MSILMTWIYNSTGGSVLLVALFHASPGLLGEFLAIPNTPGMSLVSILLNLFIWVAAAMMVLIQTTHLAVGKPEMVWQSGPDNP